MDIGSIAMARSPANDIRFKPSTNHNTNESESKSNLCVRAGRADE